MNHKAALPAFMIGLMVWLTCGVTALAGQPAAKPIQLSLANKPWKGDFDQMLEWRMIRVLMPYSRTLYYVDKGH